MEAASTRKIELTAPAGGPKQLVAALNAGADSVYLGYKKYGARAYAGNFNFKQLLWAVERTHTVGKKLYLTLNTILKDEEIPDLLDFLNSYSRICRDGIIIQDMGLLKLINELFPDIPVHASTQMNIHNSRSLDFADESGISRVVLAREMTASEIKGLDCKGDVKLEVFGHGSQCYGFSGICYFSSFTGGRSGNRGRCTQPCRMRYDLVSAGGKKLTSKPLFLISKNDLYTLEILPDLIGSGIDALKIEGRMKTPEYTAIVVKTYRKYIDMYYSSPGDYRVDKRDVQKVRQIFSRELGPGYYTDDFGGIVSTSKSGSIGNPVGRIKDIVEGSKKDTLVISGKIPIRKGDILEIWTKKGSSRIDVKELSGGAIKKGYKYYIEISKGCDYSPKDRVFKYFDKKLDGEAKSMFAFEPLETAGPGKPAAGVHEAEKLKQYIKSCNIGNERKEGNLPEKKESGLTLRIYDVNGLKNAADTGADNIMITDFNALKDGRVLKETGKYSAGMVVDTPEIVYDSQMEQILIRIEELLKAEDVKIRVSNIGILEALSRSSQEKSGNRNIILGSSLNISNTLSALYYSEILDSLAGWEFSPELDRYEISEIISSWSGINSMDYIFSVYAYGFYKVITARHEIKYSGKNMGKRDDLILADKKKYMFRLLQDNMHNTSIYNSKRICTLFDLDAILEIGINDLLIDSIFLDARQAAMVVKSYRKAVSFIGKGKVSDYKRHTGNLKSLPEFMDYSRGHLFRPVE